LSLVVLAKLLQPRDFGVFSISLALVKVAGIFTNMIFHDALVQQSVVTEKNCDGAFAVSIALSLIVYALLWIASHQPSTTVSSETSGERSELDY